MTHHYRDSGLDNVYLENGYTMHDTSYGSGVSVQDTEGLHRAIGMWLTSMPRTINGAELRFLRLEMEMTQRNLSAVLNSTEQNVRRWEKARQKAIPGPADRLVRALYREYIGGDGSVRAMVDRLADLDEVIVSAVHMRETDEGWTAEAA